MQMLKEIDDGDENAIHDIFGMFTKT